MRIWTAILFAAVLLMLSGCKKALEEQQKNFYQAYFETNVLNRDFIVKLATDTSRDITAQYSGYFFQLKKNTYNDGPMTATKGTNIYIGTWSCNEDYSKLTITFTGSTLPAEFTFLTREWRFTKKDVDVMELAPWGSSDPKVLHMTHL